MNKVKDKLFDSQAYIYIMAWTWKDAQLYFSLVECILHPKLDALLYPLDGFSLQRWELCFVSMGKIIVFVY